MSKFKSKRQEKLTNRVTANIIAERDKDFTDRSTFNFSFFDNSGKYGENFSDWNHKELVSLLDELKVYSEKSLNIWRTEKRGGGTNFSNYPDFPNGSSFKVPKGIPSGAKWGSLRISTKMRIIGFRMTGKDYDHISLKGLEYFDDNIFYIVWLDKDHKAFPRQNSGKIKR